MTKEVRAHLIALAPRMAAALRVIAADPGEMLPEALADLRAQVMTEIREILRELDGGEREAVRDILSSARAGATAGGTAGSGRRRWTSTA